MAEDYLKYALESIAEDVIETAQRELGATRMVRGKKRRSVATGTLKRSLSYNYTIRRNNPVVDFSATGKAAEYLRFVLEGRRNGAKMPPIEPILAWMKVKPIRLRKPNGGGFEKVTPAKLRSAAWTIARSIATRGIEPFPFYANAIESVLDRRGAEIEEAFEKEIEFRLKLK